MKCTNKSSVLIGAAVGIIVWVNSLVGLLPDIIGLPLTYLALAPLADVWLQGQMSGESAIGVAILIALFLSITCYAVYGFLICKILSNSTSKH